MQPRGNKVLLERDATGIPIAAHVAQAVAREVDDVVVAIGDVDVQHRLSAWVPDTVQFRLDEQSFEGPLVGVASALKQLQSTSYLTFSLIAGDLPGFHECVLHTTLHRLLHSPGVDGVAVVREHRLQPLIASYRWSVADTLVAAAQRGEHRILRALDECVLETVQPDEHWSTWWTCPVHTPSEYQAWRALEL